MPPKYSYELFRARDHVDLSRSRVSQILRARLLASAQRDRERFPPASFPFISLEMPIGSDRLRFV